MKFVSLILFIVFSVGCKTTTKNTTVPTTSGAQFERTIYWTCTERFDYDSNIKITLVAYPIEGLGEVIIDGDIEGAEYTKEGLKHYWFFGEVGKYQIHLAPDGDANYYDFSNADEAKPELMMECERRQ